MGFIDPNVPVAKGPVTYCLDELSTRVNPRKDARPRLVKLRKEIIGLKKVEFRGLEKVLAEHLLAHIYRDPKKPDKPDQEKIKKVTEYLESYWFNEKTGAWPHFQPIAPIYANGLLKTLNASLSSRNRPPIPIDSYWTVGHSCVELVTLVSPRQVTLLIATPAPVEIAPSGIWGETSEAWATVRRAGKVEHEVDPANKDARVRGRKKNRICTYKIKSRPQQI